MCEQRNGVLMHYNELQSRSSEVEAMATNFEQGVAGAVAAKGWVTTEHRQQHKLVPMYK
jgi:hypothetical protein